MKKLGILRSNRNELKKEIQRCRDTLQTLEPGTPEYGICVAQYEHLLESELDLKKVDVDWAKIGWGAFGAIGSLFVYRYLWDKSADPLFRDFGKQILNAVKHTS